MGWGALAAVILQIVLELLKLKSESNKAKTEKEKEIVKHKTESVQAIARGVIDNDESRINDHFDRLRRLREKR